MNTWGTCDNCGRDAWVVPWERDFLDEVVTEICAAGCEPEDDWEQELLDRELAEREARAAEPTPIYDALTAEQEATR